MQRKSATLLLAFTKIRREAIRSQDSARPPTAVLRDLAINGQPQQQHGLHMDAAADSKAIEDAVSYAQEVAHSPRYDHDYDDGLVVGGSRELITANIGRLSEATLALRAIAKAETMPMAALDLLESVSMLVLGLLSTKPSLMFRISVSETFKYLRAVNDFIEAVSLWELHLHEGPMPQVDNHISCPQVQFVFPPTSGSESRAAQVELLYNLRFIAPRAGGNTDPRQKEDISASVHRILRLVFSMVSWGGDRVGATYARTLMAVRATQLFKASCHVSIRDEAHELLAHFISYHASDFSSHSRLHVPDLAVLINCCKDLAIDDLYTWGAISDAAAKVQSSFKAEDRRWLATKQGTVVPKRLRGINLSSDPNPQTSRQQVLSLSDIARPLDDESDPAIVDHFASLTASAYSHLSVRETFMLTSQIAAIGKSQRHSGDKGLYERYLYQDLVGSLLLPAAGKLSFKSANAPRGFQMSLHADPHNTEVALDELRKAICLNHIRACTTLCCPMVCPLPAQGPRRRLFIACMMRAQTDLALLNDLELSDAVSKFESLMSKSHRTNNNGYEYQFATPVGAPFDEGLRAHVTSFINTLKIKARI